MYKKIKIRLSLFIFVILSFLIPYKSFASDSFVDNFYDINNWDTILNGSENSWLIENDRLVGSVGRGGNSFIITKKSNFGGKFNIAYKAINQVGVDQELLFGVNKSNPNYYVINVRFYEPGWTSDGANEVKLFNCFSFTTNSCTQKAVKKISGFNLEKNKEYSFRLEVDSGNVKFFIDNILVLDYLSNVNYNGNVGFWNWGGDYGNGVSNVFDDFIVEYGDFNTPTATPTTIPTVIPTPTTEPTIIPTPTTEPTTMPTPTPTLIPTAIPTSVPIPKRKKIFILPGLGASWNSEAMVFGNNVGDNQWKMTPFVNNYDGLIELLENNELKKDIDYFVWNYDWRKSLGEIEAKFDSFIDSKNLDENDEIYLMGHSLGGLVARLWASDNLDNYEIKEVITLGSPHLGSLDSYSVWNGAEVFTTKGVSSVAFKILLGLQNKSYLIKDLNKIRSYVPIMKDLLPVFDYASKNDQLVSWQSLESKNNNLYNKNQSINNLGSKLNLFVGVGCSTPNVLKLGKRSVYDKALGLWPDGKIITFSSSDGDGTVLKNSAGFGLGDFSELNSDHGAIVNKSIGAIAEKLGLNNKMINFSYIDNFSDSLIVFIGSPATGKLICRGIVFEEIEGFILAPNENFKECELVLSPTNNGTVHLIFGNTNNNNWTYLEKEVIIGKNEKIQINFTNGKLVYEWSNRDFLINSIKSDLKELNLNKAIYYLEKNDLTKVVAYVFYFRDKDDERIISQRILDNLFTLASIIGPDKRKFDYKWIDKHLDLVDKLVAFKTKRKPLSINSAKSWVTLENLNENIENMINEKKYPNYSVVNVLLAGYSKEILMN